MAEKNSTQNIVTVVSVVIALAAVAYAMTLKMDHKTVTASDETIQVNTGPEKTFEVTEQNPVVMEVNGEEVTRVEVLNNFMKSGAQLPQGMNIEQIFPMIQQQYVMTELIKSRAAEQGIDEDNAVVQQRLQDVKDQAIRAAYLEELGQELVTDNDIQNAYNDIVDNQPEMMERKGRHILVEDEAKANAIIVKLNQGSDFATLAEENSAGPSAPRGGDLGYFTKDEMVPEFSNAAFDLEIGEFTQQPVETQFGYHVIMVEDERAREKPTFEEVKDQLANQLRQAAIAEELEKMRQEADIVLYDLNGNEVVPEESAMPSAGETETTGEESVSETDVDVEANIEETEEMNVEEEATE